MISIKTHLLSIVHCPLFPQASLKLRQNCSKNVFKTFKNLKFGILGFFKVFFKKLGFSKQFSATLLNC